MNATPYATKNYTHTDGETGRATVKMCGHIARAAAFAPAQIGGVA